MHPSDVCQPWKPQLEPDAERAASGKCQLSLDVVEDARI